MASRLGKLGFGASLGTYLTGVGLHLTGVRALQVETATKLGLLVRSSITPKASTFERMTYWAQQDQRRCAWFTRSSVGCSAISRGISTPIGCRSSGQLSIGGLRLLCSSTSQTVKEKAGKFEKLKNFARSEWKNMDSRSKFTVFELIAKCILLGFSGGWGLMLAYSVIHRVDKVEEAMKRMGETIEKLEAQLAASEERSDKQWAEIDAKFEQLRLEVNELRSFKDLWVAYAFKRESPDTPSEK